MEWLSKAGDLLDKLDKQAAEKLENVGLETVTPPGEEDLINILNENQEDVVGLDSAEKEVAGDGDGDAALKREVQRLEGLVRKKTDQIEQLVASHRATIKASADSEKKRTSEIEKAQGEVTKALAAKRAAEKGKEQAEQQVEAVRSALKGQSEELEALRAQASNHRSEHDVLSEEILRLEGEVTRHQQLHASVQKQYEAAVARAQEGEVEHRSEFATFQEREEALSSDTLHFTKELANAERRRQEAETSARELQGKVRAAEEKAEEEARRVAEALRRAERAEREARVAREEVAAAGRGEEERVLRAEAEARESKKKMEEAQLQLRQLERIHSTASSTPYQRAGAQDADLQAQLSKMCEEVLAKQAVLEGLMGEKVALRSRLEAEQERSAEIGAQLARWQAAVRNADPEAGGLGEPPKMAIGEAVAGLVGARSLPAAVWALDDLLRVSAGHVAADTAVRSIAGAYLLLLQLSAFIVLLHALLGRHH